VFVKRRLLSVALVLAVAVAAGSVAGCGDELPDNAVAKVGEVYISNDDFNARVGQEAGAYGLTQETDPETYKQIQDWVLEGMIWTELALVEAEDLGLTATDEEVQNSIDTIANDYFEGDQAKFEEELTAEGYTLDEFKEMQREGLLANKVYDEITKDVTTVPNEQIAAYYEANKADYTVEASREVRHILIAPEAGGATGVSTSSSTAVSGTTTSVAGSTATTSDAGPTTSTTPTSAESAGAVTEADWAVALAAALEVRDSLMGGGDWTELAAEYSDDPSNKDSGGDLGTVYEGEMVEAFEQAAFSLQLDEISAPVRTTYGYHVIQVTGITEGGQQPLEEVRDQIESTLLEEAKLAAWSQWVEQAKIRVGVIYRSDMRPTTTTTAAPAETTGTTGQTTTTAPAATTTAAPAETTTTAPAETTTTAEP
jgi:parvulin-like peptidyl-prolyl isomerase